MTVLVHSIVIICFKFLFVDHLGPTATLNVYHERLINKKSKLTTFSLTRRICHQRSIVCFYCKIIQFFGSAQSIRTQHFAEDMILNDDDYTLVKFKRQMTKTTKNVQYFKKDTITKCTLFIHLIIFKTL